MTRTRTFTSSALAVAMFTALLVFVASQPAMAAESCGDVVLVLDESGSIEPNEAIVRSAVEDFLMGIGDTGSSAAIIEFGTASNQVFGFMEVNGANLTSTFSPYLDGSSAGDIYDAPSQTGPYTNWDDALDDVSLLDTTAHPDPLVLFLTDGDPTAYNLDHTGEAGGVSVTSVSTALARAVEEATQVKAQGSHLIAVGLGASLSSGASLGRLEAVSGTRHFDGSGPLDLDETDVVLIPDFAELPAVMSLIAEAMCADPEIEIMKSASAPVVTAGSEVTYTIEVTNTGNTDLHNVTVTDPLVPSCSRVIGTLAAGETSTYQCTTVLWAPLTNTAVASGSDNFGTTVNDQDSASVLLRALGTGTPGYWKNHTDAWPVFGDQMIIGDWNHDTVCSGGEVCLELSLDDAAAALSQPARGDTTWILGRALIAAWLNVSSGNDSSCVAQTIDDATAWLLVHPMGSGVGGGTDAWAVAQPLAEELDAYNNGLLCAEHRDSTSGAEISVTESNTTSTTTTTTTFPGKGKAKGRTG